MKIYFTRPTRRASLRLRPLRLSRALLAPVQADALWYRNWCVYKERNMFGYMGYTLRTPEVCVCVCLAPLFSLKRAWGRPGWC